MYKIYVSSSFAVDRFSLVQLYIRGHNFRLIKQHHTVNVTQTLLLAALWMHEIPYLLLHLTVRVWAVIRVFLMIMICRNFYVSKVFLRDVVSCQAVNDVVGERVYHVWDILLEFLGHNFVSSLRTLKPKINFKNLNKLKL